MKSFTMDKKVERRKGIKRLAFWTLAWVLSVALVSFGGEFLWDGNQAMSIAAIGLNLLIGILMVLANRRFVENLDELEKKIQLESMGLTLVVGLAYSLLDVTNIIPWDAEISFLVMFMGICYLATVGMNTRRYR
jgi:cytochrome c biogenesis protein CcdA